MNTSDSSSIHLSRDKSLRKTLWFFLLFGAMMQGIFIDMGPGFSSFFNRTLVDGDCYMRLLRVLLLFETGDWYNTIIPRSNAPFGQSMHWTKPLDIILFLGASLGAIATNFKASLYWWGVFLSPVLEGISLFGLIYVAKLYMTRDQLTILCGLFLLQPSVAVYYIAGRPDHHSLLLTIFIWLLAVSIYLVSQPIHRGICWIWG